MLRRQVCIDKEEIVLKGPAVRAPASLLSCGATGTDVGRILSIGGIREHFDVILKSTASGYNFFFTPGITICEAFCESLTGYKPW